MKLADPPVRIALIAALLIGAFVLGTRFAPTQPAGVLEMDQPLTPRSRIALPGVFGRIDHFSYDRRRGNLFVAALGNNTVEVIKNLRTIHTIKDLERPQGVLYVEEFDRLVVSDQEGKLRF
jgi:hypothetical protein